MSFLWILRRQDSRATHLRAAPSSGARAAGTGAAFGVAGSAAVAAVGLAISSRSTKAGHGQCREVVFRRCGVIQDLWLVTQAVG